MKTLLNKLFAGEYLLADEAEQALEAMTSGEVTPEEIGAFLSALRMRGESPEEIAGFARALRKAMIPVVVNGPSLDTCGTGGDGANTFNISTAVSLVMATLGVQVVKHGNRAVSSQSGSADMIEQLGIPILETPEAVQASLKAEQFGFCFAPAFHPTLKSVAALRRNLGVRTVFNLLGPLCNPAQVSHQVLGVYSPQLTETLAQALAVLGAESAWVVSSLDGLDELSISGLTQVSELQNGRVRTFIIAPQDAGLKPQSLSEVQGGSPEYNRQVILGIFQGHTGAARDIVLLNAAAALQVMGTVDNLKDGVSLAAEALDSGAVLKKLEGLRAFQWPAS